MKYKIILVFMSLITLIVSCLNTNNSSEFIQRVESRPKDVSKKIYNINGEDIVIRTGPGKKFRKLINKKATQALGETQHCEVDFSTKFEF